MRGWLEGGLGGKKTATVEWLARALEVLDWGKIAWKDASPADRGVIFDTTFVRGVRSLHLNAFMEVGSSEFYGKRSNLNIFIP